ncbi:MAG: DUF222 domain-containing protein, partial [Acidimicrobiia bacterium]|nr:DUF222 domain-containing protein [Acidimicrobiia bacterium]
MFDTIASESPTLDHPAASPAVPEGLRSVAPGEELARLLAQVEWDRLTPRELVVVLQAQQRQVAHYQAGQYWTVNQVVSAYEDLDCDDPVGLADAAAGASAEVGAALRLTRRSSDLVTELAVGLLRRLPVVWRALLEGDIDLPRARVLVNGTCHVDAGAAQAVVEMIMPDAGLLTTGQLGAKLRKLCMAVDPDAAKRRYEASVYERRLVLEANDTGTANLLGLDLPPHVAAAVKRQINLQARRLRRNGDDRTMDQLRADIYLDLLSRHTQADPRSSGGRAQVDGGVHLVVDAETLAGSDDHPGEIQGFGPVIADIARQVAEHQRHTPW